ncbi:hypothetical protein [Haloprofundus halobius]|uniref:hypothetical protein n=1 Tax=Haloprofundus halobius TaxID=2876194 RepID=UPI001CCECFA7|nr:hypothetical protein [Haloprofundus halobius]
MQTTNVTTSNASGRARLFGIAAVVGGVVLLASMLTNSVYPRADEIPGTMLYSAFYIATTAAAALLTVGAVAAVARFRETLGRVGLAGAALAALGFLSMTIGGTMNYLDANPAAPNLPGGSFAFIGLLVAIAGSAVVGIALWRSGVAKTAGALAVVALVVFAVGFAVGPTAVAGIDVLFAAFALAFCAAWILIGREETRAPAVAETTASSV